ncbi:COX15/CtaA family protein [Paenibacillus nasutitermitis]|uniref:Heme A synthase n=1 Tax=Paenibacillus nasutitermitis TaxID=1652958 RepID=A0A917DVK1_9BACL|nr:COX15/CtaA family protein [Paenibacillus nasutitermitis]GGD75277.1 heme A synthase [Paenibacillus nasutitermitis]
MRLTPSRYRYIAIAACIGMFLVLIAGSLVTNTDSGRGCGTDFPLCHGKFIPAYTLESLIEYSHRLISGLVGLLVLAVFISTLVLYRRKPEAVIYASLAGFFTLLQAVLGAIAVVWEQSAAVLAMHFGFSILAFVSTLLLVFWVNRVRRGTIDDKPLSAVPRSVFRLVLGVLIYTYIVVYLGAFVRHTDSSGGCQGWPLCNGEFIPTMEGATGIVFIHRLGALVLLIAVIWLWRHVSRVCATNPELRRTASLALALICLQIVSGAVLTATLSNDDLLVFTSILHNIIVSFLFGIMADLMVRAWKWQEGRFNRPLKRS